MLARHLTRAALRPAYRPTTFATRALITYSAKRSFSEIPVVSYEGGHRHEEVIRPTNSSASGPVSPAGQDEQKKAHALATNAYEHLTPTLSRFTLRDKVAVVTGYASRATIT